jgi:2,5-diketo-D-gluconate reductase A
LHSQILARRKQVGLGLYKVPSEDTMGLVVQAMEVGYRLFDTATFYANEGELGHALRESGLPRSEYFVTSKAWLDELGKVQIRDALRRSLDRLAIDYIDCYMIHWPAPKRDRYVESFSAILEMKREGLIRHTGVSNFHIEHLERLRSETGALPELHQLEYHPYLQQREILSYHIKNGIETQAWSPLARGLVFHDKDLAVLAEQEGVSQSQLVIGWALQNGVSVIPKASSTKRLVENLVGETVRLGEETMNEISGYDCGHRTGVDPNDRN